MDDINNLIKDIETHINNFSMKGKEEGKQLIENLKEERKTIILIEEGFFKNYLFQLNKFFKCINNTFLKDLSIYNFNSKENQKVFEYLYFIFLIMISKI